MRITGGEARGLRLRAPRTGALRPTSDRVRNALFQLVGEWVMGARMLDLYAGSGALGIEALSRGATWVDFVEQDAQMCKTIQSNLQSAGFGDRGHAYRARVEKALAFLKEPYDIVLMDPPYDLPGLEGVLETLERFALVGNQGLVVVEHSSRVAVADTCGGLRRMEQRRYGDTTLSIYRMERS